MKNLLCYLGIFVLLFLILFPPMLKIFLPDKSKIETKEEAYVRRNLSCSGKEFASNTSYDNDKVVMIILKKFMQNEEENSAETKSTTNKKLIDLFERLKNENGVKYNILENGDETILIDYSVSELPDLKVPELKMKLEEQQKYYEDNNLVCRVIE